MANTTERHARDSHSPSPLPLSRTCQNCAHAKIKCTRANHPHICDRCNRLSKECIFRQAKRRHNGSRKDNRIEALEAKVNQLLVATTQPLRPVPSDHSGYGGGTETSPSVGSSRQARDVIDEGLLDMEIARRYLDVFRTTMVHRFPFIVISPDQTARRLREEKPFLFLTILAAASYENMPLQRRLGDEVKRVVGNRMILDGEISFELLQGIMVYVAWCHYYNTPRLHTQLLQLAMSIIVDLRLNRPKANGPKVGLTSLSVLMGEESEVDYQTAWGQSERRAVAGCFYLTSTVSIMLQKTSTFPFSGYIEESCKTLRDEESYPTDRYLIYIVRLQAIAEKIDQLFNQRTSELSLDSTTEMLVKQFQRELDVFKERLPFSLSESYLLAMQYHAVELTLYQIVLLDRSTELDIPRLTPPSTWRFDILCAGLISAKSLLSYFLSAPARTHLAFSNTEWIQIGVATIVATKLSAAIGETPAGSEALGLGKTLGVMNVVIEVIDHVGQLSTQVVDANNRRDVFHQYWKRGKLIQYWCEKNASKVPSIRVTHSNDYYGSAGQQESNHYPPQIPQQTEDFLGVDMGITDLDQLLEAEMSDIQLAEQIPDFAMDGIMADWMSFPLLPF